MADSEQAGPGQEGREVLSGEFHLPPNQTWQLGRLRTFASDQQLYLLEWQVEGGRLAGSYGNHYIAGRPPFDLAWGRAWPGPRKSEKINEPAG